MVNTKTKPSRIILEPDEIHFSGYRYENDSIANQMAYVFGGEEAAVGEADLIEEIEVEVVEDDNVLAEPEINFAGADHHPPGRKH